MSIRQLDTYDFPEHVKPHVDIELLSHADSRAEVSPYDKLDAYFELREAAKAEPVPDDADVARIQREVDGWLRPMLDPKLLPYGQHAEPATRAAVLQRFMHLNQWLNVYHGHEIPAIVLGASNGFVDMVGSMYDMYQSKGENEAKQPTVSGSFGFVVPARGERGKPEVSKEAIDPCPSLRYVPEDLRIAMFAGVPPFVVDRFKPDNQGKPGYMLLAPVFMDMQADLQSNGYSRKDALRIAQETINDTVRFGRDTLDLRVFGLGAILPMYTQYGRSINVEDVVTTTGHGGTVALIMKTVEELRNHDGALKYGASPRIGVLGLGTIGQSNAAVVAASYPDAKIHMFDTDSNAMSRAGKALARDIAREAVIPAQSIREVIESSSIIISAVTGAVDLEALGITDLEGKIFIDDSQPWAFDRKQVERLGGRVVWVAGRDADGNVAVRDTSWGYGGTLVGDSEFGCALEAATTARVLSELEAHPELLQVVDTNTGVRQDIKPIDFVREEVALRGPVTPDDVLRFQRLFNRMGITIAPFQAEGELTNFSESVDADNTNKQNGVGSEIDNLPGNVIPARRLQQQRLRRLSQFALRNVLSIFI